MKTESMLQSPVPIIASDAAHRAWKPAVAALACAVLSACGGGGSGGAPPINSTPPPPPPAPPLPPPPPPPPPPSAGGFDTAEFRFSDGPDFHGAQSAWGEGATGAGEIIAIIDSGIDADSPEFTGRIHPASRDVAGNRGINGENDHGTNVAAVAAAARNDEGILGIAFDAQVLALRADMPGSCGADTPQDSSLGCVFADRDIATGIDRAIATGASVINLSLGGGSAAPELRAALGRAADAGIVVVIAAGNAGDGSNPDIPPDQPDPFAADAVRAGNGNVIIVGSVDAGGALSGFSNQAGAFAESYLTALGERICCVYENGEVFVERVGSDEFITLFSGTSFATPQVAGAVALLAQAFPNLEATEIVEILLASARDAGAAGADPVFGRGILDIAAAFRPQGTLRLAGTDNPVSFAGDFALGSAAMGDALKTARLTSVGLDRYDRAYGITLAASAARDAAQVQRLRGAVERGAITRNAVLPGFAASVTVGEGDLAAGLGWRRELQLTPQEAIGARVLAARVAAEIAPDMQIGLAIAQGAQGLVGQLQGARHAAFAIAPRAGADTGFTDASEFAIAVRQELDGPGLDGPGLGGLGLTVSAERGAALLGNNRREGGALVTGGEQRTTARLGVFADRSFGAVEASAGITWLAEGGTMLGGWLDPALGFRGSDTVFLDAGFEVPLARRWHLGTALRYGITRPRGGALIAPDSQIRSEAWSLDLARAGVFGARDTLGLRISQPLRVSGGSIGFDLPVAWDYASESAVAGRQTLSLSPEGREIMSELAWSAPLLGGWARTSLFHRRQPGHFAAAPDDVGAVVSFSAQF